MKLAFDTVKLGGILLGIGPVIMQTVAEKKGWWLGFGFTVLGPFLMSWKCRKRDSV